jgi:hypothetical protein
MPIKVTCPKCQGVLHAPDDSGGKRGKCPTCGTVLSIPADSPRVGGEGSAAAEPPRPAFGGAPRPTLQESEPELPTRGSAFGGGLPKAPAPEPRGPMGPSRPLPSPPQPTGQGGPFAKTGKKPAPVGQDPEGAEKLAKAWKRARRGLFWLQLAGFLFLISWLGYYGLSLAEKFGVKLPEKNPGYLGQNDLTAAMEIRYAIIAIPTLLGVMFVVLGRLGYTNVPKNSLAKGMAFLAMLSTLLAFMGAVMFLVPTAGAIYFGQPFTKFPDHLLRAEELNGILQRAGVLFFVGFGLLAEIYFHSSLGRLAAHLNSSSLSRRGVLRAFIYGAVLILGSAWLLAQNIYARDVSEFVAQQIQPQWDKLGENKTTVLFGVAIFLGLVVWFLYTRLVGAARGAIGEWLDQNDPSA